MRPHSFSRRHLAFAGLAISGLLTIGGSAGQAADPSAAARATTLARAAGLVPSGRPDVRRAAGAGGWSISWQRLVDGVPVRGDGLRLTLWPDGGLHGLTRTERPLAPAPSRVLDAAAA